MALLVVFGFWYIALPIGLIGLWKMPAFVEFVIAGFAYDALYGGGAVSGAWGHIGTFITLSLALLAFSLKSSLR